MKKSFYLSRFCRQLLLSTSLIGLASAALAADLPVPLSSGSQAPKQNPPAAAPAKKSQFNSQVYEKAADDAQSFTAVVKIVREIDGDIQVFFEGKQGFYTVLSGSEGLLVTSQKKHIPVAVTVTVQSRQVIKVDLAPESALPPKGQSF